MPSAPAEKNGILRREAWVNDRNMGAKRAAGKIWGVFREMSTLFGNVCYDMEEDRDRVVFIDTRDKIPRKFYITRKDVQEHGYTKNCPGCTSWKNGEAKRPHTKACRDRLEESMKGQARLENRSACVGSRDYGLCPRTGNVATSVWGNIHPGEGYCF